MTANSSAIAPATAPQSPTAQSPALPTHPALRARTGVVWAALGVLAFSFTVPMTRISVTDLPPEFVASGRAVVAAVCALVLLLALRQPLPPARLVGRLVVVALGVVLGFPWLTSTALTTVPASHAAVVIGLLPAATAVASVLRTRQRPGRRFWLAAGAGALAVVAFATLATGGPSGLGGLGSLHSADLLIVGAVVAAAVGYAEGALVAQEIGAWQTICWALVLALPAMLALAVASAPTADAGAATGSFGAVGATAWLAFAYLSVVSMWLGFFPWYRGLAIGPVAQVSQVQLVQPVMTITWAALLLGEQLTWPIVAGGLAVVGCAAVAVRSR